MTIYPEMGKAIEKMLDWDNIHFFLREVDGIENHWLEWVFRWSTFYHYDAMSLEDLKL